MPNLVLTRQRGEAVKVVIDGEVILEITLVGLSQSGTEGKLAFLADERVKIYRNEVWERYFNKDASGEKAS